MNDTTTNLQVTEGTPHYSQYVGLMCSLQDIEERIARCVSDIYRFSDDVRFGSSVVSRFKFYQILTACHVQRIDVLKQMKTIEYYCTRRKGINEKL